MATYGRKYKALAIIGYIICLAVAALLIYTLFDGVIIPTINNPEGAGWGVVGFVLVWAMCAPVQVIPLVLGVIGWILTARANGKGAKRYKLLTFLPLILTFAPIGIVYLI